MFCASCSCSGVSFVSLENCRESLDQRTDRQGLASTRGWKGEEIGERGGGGGGGNYDTTPCNTAILDSQEDEILR